MSRVVGMALFALFCLGMSVAPVHAAGNSTSGTSSSGVSSRSDSAAYWKQHDTAAYVVSTLNLLRYNHQPLVKAVTTRLQVVKYTVYEDLVTPNLYFIEMRRADGSVAASVAYMMGWTMPRSVSPALDPFGVQTAPDKLIEAYKNDAKRSMATFKSTSPS